MYAGRTVCVIDNSTTKWSTKDTEQREKNTISMSTAAHKRGRATHDVVESRNNHLSSKKAGNRQTLVRKATVLNRVRLNIQQTAATRGHDRVWSAMRLAALNRGLELVAGSTGAISTGSSRERVPGPIVPRAWRPYTTASVSVSSSILVPNVYPKGLNEPDQQLQPESEIYPNSFLRPTSIMTPLEGADEDEASFPNANLDSRYADTSDDDVDGVYADFGVLFDGRNDLLSGPQEDEHCYEEYLDRVHDIICSS
jgi:hypothetical protein